MAERETAAARNGLEIAVVGMAGRFPGAPDLDRFWHNLCAGVESITFFSRAELAAAGVPKALAADPAYVAAHGVLDGIELFDAPFFGLTPRDAEILDPQHRLFLECAWLALESSGCDPARYPGWIGVFAGVGQSSYYLKHLTTHPELIGAVGRFQVSLANEKDFLATRVSYKLDLRGPSLDVQTACSTSLVAVHLACQSLLRGECDLALAGGVSVSLPQESGYLHQEGGILSIDGHTRTFDAAASGCVGGNGAGAVALARLDEALAGGLPVRAVIKGSAINNDGGAKLGFTAPQIDGQARAIRAAHLLAEVHPESVTYVEAHGTATELGDPIEVAGLTQAFRSGTARRGFCALGSVKTNVGHLDAAAGVAGLIKTVLALEHRQIPPSLHFSRPNPRLDLETTPFYVNAALAPWAGPAPRRAGVSSFGMGGTNAHLIVEEAPPREAPGASRPWQLLPLSARSAEALESAAAGLARRLAAAGEETALADVAHTLQVGRAVFACRRLALCCNDAADAVAALTDPARRLAAREERGDRPVAFLFPGQGAQHPGMGAGLYHTEAVFRREVEACIAVLEPPLGREVRLAVLAPPLASGDAEAERRLTRTALAQPALFTVEYALARLWQSWGVRPAAMLGHSLGEYVAACLAGVLKLADALRLVAARGRLMQEQPPGAMLTVALPAAELGPFLGDDLALAAVNGPAMSVAAGPTAAIAALRARCEERGAACRVLRTSHAFHSAAMEPVMAALAAEMRQVTLTPPSLPYLSNLTGTWIRAEEATDPVYWGRQLRETVRFDSGLRELFARPDWVLLEVGPGRALSRLAERHPERPAPMPVLASCLPPPARDARPGASAGDAEADQRQALETLGRLWLAGAAVDWQGFAAGERRRRVVLPGYPFERRRHWVDAAPPAGPGAGEAGNAEATAAGWAAPSPGDGAARPAAGRRSDPADWFYWPQWRELLPAGALPAAEADGEDGMGGRRWLIFRGAGGPCSLAGEVAAALRRRGGEVVEATAGAAFGRQAGRGEHEERYTLDRRRLEDHQALWRATGAGERPFDGILDLTLLDSAAVPAAVAVPKAVAPTPPPGAPGDAKEAAAAERPVVELAVLAQALGEELIARQLAAAGTAAGGAPPVKLLVVASGLHEVTGGERLAPAKATVLGAIRVLPQEVPGLAAASIDVEAPASAAATRLLAEELAAELAAPATEPVTAWRGGRRWVQRFEPLRVAAPPAGAGRLRRRGVYLITGGMGGLGMAVAEVLAREWQARLVLTGRSRPRRRLVRRLEEQGGEVLALRADVADRARMAAVLAHAARRFGPLNGVFHAAGLPGSGLVHRLTAGEIARVLRPKVQGTLVLGSLCDGADLDFVVLFSSHRSLLGGAGSLDYCAANAFLDAFAQERRRTRPGTWIAINWDGWREVGMGRAEEAAGRAHAAAGNGTAAADEQLSTSEGLEALRRVLGLRLPQVVVSTGDFAVRLARQRAARAEAALERLGAARRAQTASPRPATLSTPYVAPRDAVEEKLAGIWSALLGIAPIGVEDSFIELGGDSVAGLQAAAKANQAGLALSAREVLQHQTIAELAAVARTAAAMPRAEAGAVTGPLPLTPIQRWLGERRLERPHHYNQAVMLEVDRGVRQGPLRGALAALACHHDALRLRCVPAGEGPAWRAHLAPPDRDAMLAWADLQRLPAAAVRQAMAAAAARLHAALDLEQGPLLAAALFLPGGDEPARLLLVLHHLAVDGLSWPILVDDLERAYTQLAAGEPVALPAKTTSFKRWAERLADLARSPEALGQLAFWLDQPWSAVAPLPLDLDGGPNVAGATAQVRAALDQDRTRDLVQRVPQAYRVQVQEVLLAAVAAALAAWTGGAAVALDLEGHGREALFADCDLSRTVGWFTSLFPLVVESAPGSAPGERLKQVKERLRTLPAGGMSYGLLRYMNGDPVATAALAALPGREVVFLFTGAAPRAPGEREAGGAGTPGALVRRLAAEPSGPNQDPGTVRPHLLELVAGVRGGRLELAVTYSRHHHRAATVAAFADACLGATGELIAHCLSAADAGYTPADFPAAGLSQQELDQLVADLGA